MGVLTGSLSSLQLQCDSCDKSPHNNTIIMSNIIPFSHWFWITLLTLSFHCNVLLSTNDESVVVLKDSARRESKSIDSSSSYVNVLRAEAEVSTSRSVSVSHVRVEVGREEQYPRLRKIRKPSQ